MEKGKSLTKNSIFYLIYNVLNIAFPFVTGIYVARVLLAGPIGEVAYAQNITNYFVIFAFLGIPTYGLREISKVRGDKNELNKLYSELFTINLISTCVFLLAYLILIFSVPSFRSQYLLFLITGIAIAANAIQIDWLYEGLEEYGIISIRNILVKIICFALLVIFVRGPDDYLIYALISVVGTIGNYLFNIIYSRKFVHFSFKGLNLKRHMKSILLLTTVNLAIEISTMVDTTMLGIMCDKETVAYYSYGSKIKGILLSVINTFTMVLVPRISLYFKEKRFKECNDLLTKVTQIIVVIAVPMIIGIWFTSDYLITKIYGDDFIRSSMVLKILSFNILISPIGYLLGSRVMLVSGHESRMPWCVGAGAVVNIALNAVLIPIYAEKGASIASVISEAVTTIVYIISARKFFKLNNPIHSFSSVLIGGTVISVYLFFCTFIPASGWVIVLTQIIGAVVIYYLTLLLTKEEIVLGYSKEFIQKMGHNKKNDSCKQKKELTLKEVQQGSFKVLCKIKHICEANNIRYYLFYGTLIGAIRHNGFIPWDDDIDVMMPRPDYERFLSYCREHKMDLGNYSLMHYTTNKKYIYPIARLVDTDYTIHYNNAKNYGLGLFVDIYPYDGFNPADKKWQRQLSKNIKWIGRCGNKTIPFDRRWYRFPLRLGSFVATRFIDLNKLIEKTDKLAQKYPYDSSEFVNCMAWDWKPTIKYRREWFGENTYHIFGDQDFSIPHEFEYCLKAGYGDYMKLPPKEQRIGHHDYSAFLKNSSK
jgi:O-antigen/teichoic acid export membrane protein/phosphorylcholine metabolism protein LicD